MEQQDIQNLVNNSSQDYSSDPKPLQSQKPKEDINQYINKKLNTKKNATIIEFTTFYLIPIVAFAIFVILLFFPIRLTVMSILAGLEELKEQDELVATKSKEVQDLIFLSSVQSTLARDINLINSIAPSKQVDVSEFRQRIQDVADSIGLGGTQSQNLTERPVVFANSSQENASSYLALIEVPVRLENVGSYTQIRKLMSDIEALQDFIVFTEFSFSRGDVNVDEWGLTLTVVKYQFENIDAESARKAYLSVPVSVQINQLVNAYLEDRRN